jgi:hypothetical protein
LKIGEDGRRRRSSPSEKQRRGKTVVELAIRKTQVVMTRIRSEIEGEGRRRPVGSSKTRRSEVVITIMAR